MSELFSPNLNPLHNHGLILNITALICSVKEKRKDERKYLKH